MTARRDLLQGLSFGMASMLMPNGTNAVEAPGQNIRSSILFQNKASSTGWINFTMPEDRFIVLPVLLNNERAEVLIDSGVGLLTLDVSLAKKLGLRAKGGITGVGVTGLVEGTTTEGLRVTIGNLIITTPEATVFDLTPFSVATSRPLVAMLGYDVFGSLVVDIDFEGRKIAFRDPKLPSAIAGAQLVPLVEGRLGRRELSIKIENQRPIQAVFDLGSDTPLYISPDYAQRQQLLRGKKTSTSFSVGAEGIEENQIAVMETVEVGGMPIHKVPVEVPKKWAQDAPAVVGVPILSRYRLMVDFSRDLVWMLPYQDAEMLTFRKDRLGMAAIPATDCFRVVHISPGSPAERAGLKVGDEIVSVNGEIVDAAYLKSRPRQGIKPAGTIVHYSLRTGASLTVVLADYF